MPSVSGQRSLVAADQHPRRALIAAKLGNLQHGSNRYQEKIELYQYRSMTRAEDAKKLGVSLASLSATIHSRNSETISSSGGNGWRMSEEFMRTRQGGLRPQP
jgi:hypothetical protein